MVSFNIRTTLKLVTVLSTVSNISTLNILKLPEITGVPSISLVVTSASFSYGNYYTK